jgi:hypothetical protein
MKVKTIARITLVLSLVAFPISMSAQPYEHSAGIRAGYSSGISYKGFFRHQMAALEADFLYNNHGFNLTALFEHHIEVFRNERSMVYMGGGAFGGSWDAEFSIGVAAVGGIEYTLRDIPLNFSLDWKPMLNIFADFEFDFLDFGISIRYRIKG